MHDRVQESTKQSLEIAHGGFELVGEAEEARLLAALNRYPNRLTWRRRCTYKSGRPCVAEISGPFGLGGVFGHRGLCRLAQRRAALSRHLPDGQTWWRRQRAAGIYILEPCRGAGGGRAAPAAGLG